MGKEMENLVRDLIQASIEVKRLIFEERIGDIVGASTMIVNALREGKKVLFFGNGGSAADAQHLAAELVNRFLFNRPALPGIALTTDTSVLTCIANDAEYRFVFSRQIEAIGNEGDIAIGISTSGTSPNVIEGIKKAKERGMKAIAFTGAKKGDVGALADIAISIPSTSTPRIQESHIMIGHIICQIVEEELFPTYKKGRK